jgi:hypothetical protein
MARTAPSLASPDARSLSIRIELPGARQGEHQSRCRGLAQHHRDGTGTEQYGGPDRAGDRPTENSRQRRHPADQEEAVEPVLEAVRSETVVGRHILRNSMRWTELPARLSRTAGRRDARSPRDLSATAHQESTRPAASPARDHRGVARHQLVQGSPQGLVLQVTHRDNRAKSARSVVGRAAPAATVSRSPRMAMPAGPAVSPGARTSRSAACRCVGSRRSDRTPARRPSGLSDSSSGS